MVDELTIRQISVKKSKNYLKRSVKVSTFPLPMCRSFAGFNGIIIRGGDRTDCQEKGVYQEAASAFEARWTHTFRLTKDVKKRDGA